MVDLRIMTGLGAGALGVLALAVVPAIGASVRTSSPIVQPRLGDIDAFTPAAADPKLAALFAQAGLDSSAFRFTPTQSRRGSDRAVTVAVRARSTRAAAVAERAALAPETSTTISIAPIAYNLGVAVGWRRFALSGDMAKVDLAGRPGSREAMDVGLSYTGRRVGAQVRATADRPLAGSLPVVEAPSYGVDVGGSYSISRRIDLTAGIRYKAERDRMSQLTSVSSGARRDSQAVYIGTAFRF